ncbi:MAG: hypothetical protein J1E43_06675 [Christensenellaceae bacterium]|nr:hypothetical protein [Christensenellaceae bacterium]
MEQICYDEFFSNGGIRPNAPAYWPACKKNGEEIAFLSTRLNSEDKEHLDKLVKQLADTSRMSDYDNFAYGFRVGVLLMHEVMTP